MKVYGHLRDRRPLLFRFDHHFRRLKIFTRGGQRDFAWSGGGTDGDAVDAALGVKPEIIVHGIRFEVDWVRVYQRENQS